LQQCENFRPIGVPRAGRLARHAHWTITLRAARKGCDQGSAICGYERLHGAFPSSGSVVPGINIGSLVAAKEAVIRHIHATVIKKIPKKS
jgi:hypothetical protein